VPRLMAAFQVCAGRPKAAAAALHQRERAHTSDHPSSTAAGAGAVCGLCPRGRPACACMMRWAARGAHPCGAGLLPPALLGAGRRARLWRPAAAAAAAALPAIRRLWRPAAAAARPAIGRLRRCTLRAVPGLSAIMRVRRCTLRAVPGLSAIMRVRRCTLRAAPGLSARARASPLTVKCGVPLIHHAPVAKSLSSRGILALRPPGPEAPWP
jgi:hypothetical protein